MTNNDPEKSKNPWLVPIIVAIIGAIGVIVAAYVSHRSGPTRPLSSDSSPTAPVNPGSTAPTAPTSSSPSIPPPKPSGEGYLNNIQQTPTFRQSAGAVSYNGIRYPKSFQIDVPAGGSATYSYALNSQWSAIKLLAEVPQGGNGGAIIDVTVSIDGHQASSGYFEQGYAYAGQFSVVGITKLTISFNAGASVDANTIIVAGNLSH